MEEEYVHDSRNGRVLGPYAKGDGEKMADCLNHYTLRNAGNLVFFATSVDKVQGPFFVFPDAEPRY